MYEDQRTRPYGSPATARVFLHQLKHGSGKLVMLAAIAGLLGLLLGVASLALLVSYRSTATAQMNQVRQELTQAQSSLYKAQSDYSGLSNKISAIDAAMSALAPYSKVCSTDLTGPNGPAQFFFMCRDTKP